MVGTHGAGEVLARGEQLGSYPPQEAEKGCEDWKTSKRGYVKKIAIQCKTKLSTMHKILFT